MEPLNALKTRRENLRWMILLTLNNARPIKTHESLVLATVQGIHSDATATELRRELDYLQSLKLIVLDKQPHGVWVTHLTASGVDCVEYVSECPSGIARPEKYWG